MGVLACLSFLSGVSFLSCEKLGLLKESSRGDLPFVLYIHSPYSVSMEMHFYELNQRVSLSSSFQGLTNDEHLPEIKGIFTSWLSPLPCQGAHSQHSPLCLQVPVTAFLPLRPSGLETAKKHRLVAHSFCTNCCGFLTPYTFICLPLIYLSGSSIQFGDPNSTLRDIGYTLTISIDNISFWKFLLACN